MDIESFWEKMRSVYGRRKWDYDFPLEDCADVWERALDRYDDQTVLGSIADSARNYPDWPPTLPQFLRLCKMTRVPGVKQLEGPQKADPRLALEHCVEVKHLMALKADRPMTDEQRRIHWETLGLI